MDFHALHKTLIDGGEATEEKVEVNQRHLIDKILARYSTEYTAFRELIQNANDAEAKSVEINFITSNSPMYVSDVDILSQQQQTGKSVTLPTECDSITIRNDGRSFSGPDWNRLRKIAEGNPDVDKIGFFGVGFYSLFSLCDEPLVDSGGECMGFFWRGDQLYTRKGKSSVDESGVWTTFFLQLRDRMEIPPIDDFCKFVAMSMAFTSCLTSVKVYSNGLPLLDINKKVSPGRALPIPKTGMLSPNQLFGLAEAELSHVQLEIRKLTVSTSITKALWGFIRGAPATHAQKLEYSSYSVFMRYACGHCNVTISPKYAREMERSTKKLPPAKTKIQILFNGYEEFELTNQLCREFKALKDLVPFPDQGRVFVGFPTHQTTGCPIHLAAHFIPTVERESIDFNDVTLKVWNQDILFMGGQLCRAIYEDELDRLSGQIVSKDREKVEIVADMLKMTTHMMNLFTFKASSPSNYVSHILSKSFHECWVASVSMLSTHGIKPSSEIRMPDSAISIFSRRIPVIPNELVLNARDFIANLAATGIIRLIALSDIVLEVKERMMAEDELVPLLKWWIRLRKNNGSLDRGQVDAFMDCVLIPGCGVDKLPIPLREMRFFAGVKLIPPGLPTDIHTMPSTIARHIDEADLSQYLNLASLNIVQWCQFICSLKEIEKDMSLAEEILIVISRGYFNLNAKGKKYVVDMLALKSCVPTTATDNPIRVPSDAYFKNVTLFPDLPIINFAQKKIAESFLQDIGVRTHVELQLVFDRLDNLKWDTVQLVKYLASVEDRLSQSELSRLSNTALFSAEKLDKSGRKVSFDEATEKSAPVEDIRFRAKQLFAPNDDIRALGFPIIAWPSSRWRDGSSEHRFLIRIGLQSAVSLPELLVACSEGSPARRKLALLYFVNHFDILYRSQYQPATIETAFIPCNKPDLYCRPSECFSDPGCAVLGFNALHSDWIPHSLKLGVLDNPPVSMIIDRLSISPPLLRNAEEIFVYLASRSGNFSSSDWAILAMLSFIPVPSPNKSLKPEWRSPGRVYFRSPDSNNYDGIFEYVDFGKGNAFLKACGVKEQPDAVELLQEVLLGPAKFLSMVGIDRYMAILRQAAVSLVVIQKSAPSLFKNMQRASFLLGYKFVQNSNEAQYEHMLLKAGEINIVDDTVLRRIFNPPCAPLETLLEDLYTALGSERLSKCVKDSYILGETVDKGQKVSKLESTIRDRAALLVHEYRSASNLEQRGTSAIKSEWLTELQVIQVNGIKITRKFANASDVRPSSAALVMAEGKRRTLAVTDDFDYFDVSQIICREMLGNRKLNDALLISTLLSTSLENLKQKGFPVDRLISRPTDPMHLRKDSSISVTRERSESNTSQPAANLAREIAADQEKVSTNPAQAQLEEIFPDEEPSRIAETLNLNNGDIEKSLSDILTNPKPMEKPPALPPRMEDVKTSREQLDSAQTAKSEQKSAPKASSSWKAKIPGLSGRRADNSPSRSDREKQGAEIVRKPIGGAELGQSLAKAVENCGAYQRNKLFAPERGIDPKTIIDDNDCCEQAEEDLKRVFDLHLGGVAIPFFVNRVSSAQDYEYLTRESNGKPTEEMILFMSIIHHLSLVFGINNKALHIFWYPENKNHRTIAFFQNGSLFFNFGYFLRSMTIKPLVTSSSKILGVESIPNNYFYYWFMVFCHELAHAFRGPHDRQHEFYMASYAERYMPTLMALLMS
eukprot:Partr_v1_DN29026_c1_g3_i5_m58732 putative HATPase_c domain protein